MEYKKLYVLQESYGIALFVDRNIGIQVHEVNINCINNDILITLKHATWIYSLLSTEKEQVAAGRHCLWSE